jgi:L,D-peptidoglycan transpeptidase YkuD (ErfK/YbiS/YcfS/YnhG family)
VAKRQQKTGAGWVPPLVVPAILAVACVLMALVPAGAAAASPAAHAKAPVVRQLITVTAPAYNDSKNTTATFRAYVLSGKKWVEVFGPWTAEVGYKGVARPGQKRERDGKTPSGTYGFSFFFGVDSPRGLGFAFPFRHAYAYDYWDDDPKSLLYNEWVVGTKDAGVDPEPMHNVPAYDYAAVIAYNTARTPYLGSAIFLHVGTGGSTAGCVSLPRAELIRVLRWLRPADNPRIDISAK